MKKLSIAVMASMILFAGYAQALPGVAGNAKTSFCDSHKQACNCARNWCAKHANDPKLRCKTSQEDYCSAHPAKCKACHS